MKTRNPKSFRKQSGAALIVGLVMLLTLTLLAVSGMNTATLELTMAGNEQYSERAFQLAETGIETTLAAGGFIPDGPPAVVAQNAPDPLHPDDTLQTTTTSIDNAPVPPRRGMATSLGGAFRAYYFTTVSTGTSSRSATSTNTQSFYVIGPSGR